MHAGVYNAYPAKNLSSKFSPFFKHSIICCSIQKDSDQNELNSVNYCSADKSRSSSPDGRFKTSDVHNTYGATFTIGQIDDVTSIKSNLIKGKNYA